MTEPPFRVVRRDIKKLFNLASAKDLQKPVQHSIRRTSRAIDHLRHVAARDRNHPCQLVLRDALLFKYCQNHIFLESHIDSFRQAPPPWLMASTASLSLLRRFEPTSRKNYQKSENNREPAPWITTSLPNHEHPSTCPIRGFWAKCRKKHKKSLSTTCEASPLRYIRSFLQKWRKKDNKSLKTMPHEYLPASNASLRLIRRFWTKCRKKDQKSLSTKTNHSLKTANSLY